MAFASFRQCLKSKPQRFATGRKRGPRASLGLRFVPRLQILEGRTLPSTLTVLNNLDAGAGSLRAAISAASSGDTVNFDPSLNGQTITLTSGELVVDKSLDIEGPGANELTVSGNNASRVFNIATTFAVAISGLTVFDGNALQGGGVSNAGMLTITDAAIQGQYRDRHDRRVRRRRHL